MWRGQRKKWSRRRKWRRKKRKMRRRKLWRRRKRIPIFFYLLDWSFLLYYYTLFC
jgi:hypothetical protein